MKNRIELQSLLTEQVISLLSLFDFRQKVYLSLSLLFVLTFSSFQEASAQNNSAIVEFASPNQGFLIPRMSTDSLLAIEGPVEGLVAYDMTRKNFYFYTDSEWKIVGNNGAGVSGIPSSNIIGTTDYNPLIFITNNVERLKINEDGKLLFYDEIVTKYLTVEENVHLNSTVGVTTIDGFTTINGETAIGGPQKNQSTFTGKVNLDDELKVEGKTNLRDELMVDGIALINTFITITKTTNTKDLVVKNNVLLNSENGRTTVLGPADFGGPQLSPSTFTGSVLIDNKLTVNDIDLKNDLNVGGRLTVTKRTLLKDSLTVNNLTLLKDRLTVNGVTDLDQTLNVDGNSTLKGTLELDKAAQFKDALTVDKATLLKDNLTVTKAAQLNSTLNVVSNTVIGGNLSTSGTFYSGNQATLNQGLSVRTTASVGSSLTVAGASTLNSSLNVAGITSINNKLNVSSSVANGGFVASFTNTDNSFGDGIKIRLGKERPTVFPNPTNVGQLNPGLANAMKELISDKTDLGEKTIILAGLMGDAIVEDAKALAQLTVGLGNTLISFINGALGLPIYLGPYGVPITFLPGDDFTIPVIPRFPIVPGIPTISFAESVTGPIPDLLSREFWQIPSFNFSDVGDPLSRQNEFIRFTDVRDDILGSIRAQSISDWEDDYLSPQFMYTLYSALTTNKIDKYHGLWGHWFGELGKAGKAYASIGIEYTSRNGDYAEWLERINLNENIAAGDIVAVVGGKISKDLSLAEQVMVVSHNPIVLGNAPKETEIFKGNNVAFMGQVPVKIMGPVATGDYIVANSKTPGYGLAKHPDQMNMEDFKFAVGRSWQNIESKGPIMVNTVVGVHNGDYLKVIKNLKSQAEKTEKRLDLLEEKITAMSLRPESTKTTSYTSLRVKND